MSNLHYLFNNNVVVITDGTNVVEVQSGDKPELFQQVVNLCMKNEVQEALDLINDASDTRFLAQKIAAITDGMIIYDVVKDCVLFKTTDGRELPIVSTFGERIRTAWRSNDQQALGVYKKFMVKASNNPNEFSASDLFEFITVNKLPLSEDGDVLAYKIVKGNFKDIHSGTKDHTPGNVVTEENVDYNRENTCSAGLHFCAKEYLPAYGGSFGSGTGNRLVLVKIDPEDVVAFPRDYQNAKGRCRKYTVVSELPTQFFTAIVELMERVPYVKLSDLAVSEQIASRLGFHVEQHQEETRQELQGDAGVITDSVIVDGRHRWYLSLTADNQPAKLISRFTSRGAARDKRDEWTGKFLASGSNTYVGLVNPKVTVYDAWA